MTKWKRAKKNADFTSDELPLRSISL